MGETQSSAAFTPPSLLSPCESERRLRCGAPVPPERWARQRRPRPLEWPDASMGPLDEKNLFEYCYFSPMVWRDALADLDTQRRIESISAVHRPKRRKTIKQKPIYGRSPSKSSHIAFQSSPSNVSSAIYRLWDSCLFLRVFGVPGALTRKLSFDVERDIHAFYHQGSAACQRPVHFPTTLPFGARFHWIVDPLHRGLSEEHLLRSA